MDLAHLFYQFTNFPVEVISCSIPKYAVKSVHDVESICKQLKSIHAKDLGL